MANPLKGQTDLFRLRCDEAPEEPATVSTENALKVECHISIQTNFMHSGIKEVGGRFSLASPPFLISLCRLWTRRSRNGHRLWIEMPFTRTTPA